MRHHLLKLALALGSGLALACGPTGPASHSGASSCDQLRECACDPDRTFDPALCNQTVDAIEQGPDPEALCTVRLQQSGCGRALQVAPAGL